MKRQCSVSGSFYHHDANVLEEEFQYFDDVAAQHFSHLENLPMSCAIIVPHAGYMYSGFTASCAYRSILKDAYERVVVLGPSHRVYLDGVSALNVEGYETPFGDLRPNKISYEALHAKALIQPFPEAHQEHSTEVQFPFIYRYLNALPTLELVYGNVSHEVLSQIVETILDDPKCLLIISTDLSHFYTQSEANQKDQACIDAIEALSVKDLDRDGCEACGKAGVKALLEIAKKKGLHIQGLDYRTSGDITGDMNKVVGYYSALVVDTAQV